MFSVLNVIAFLFDWPIKVYILRNDLIGFFLLKKTKCIFRLLSICWENREGDQPKKKGKQKEKEKYNITTTNSSLGSCKMGRFLLINPIISQQTKRQI